MTASGIIIAKNLHHPDRDAIIAEMEVALAGLGLPDLVEVDFQYCDIKDGDGSPELDADVHPVGPGLALLELHNLDRSGPQSPSRYHLTVESVGFPMASSSGTLRHHSMMVTVSADPQPSLLSLVPEFLTSVYQSLVKLGAADPVISTHRVLSMMETSGISKKGCEDELWEVEDLAAVAAEMIVAGVPDRWLVDTLLDGGLRRWIPNLGPAAAIR